jgi:hypothetical protein
MFKLPKKIEKEIELSTGEKFLISVCQANAPTELQHKGLSAWFEDKPSRQLLKIIQSFYATHFRLPNLEYLEKVPEYKNLATSKIVANLQNPENYRLVLQENYAAKMVALEIPSIIHELDADPVNTLKKLGLLVDKLKIDSLNTAKLSNYRQNSLSRLEMYEKHIKEGAGGISYISSGNLIYDEIFSGYGKTQCVAIGGRAGTKKTWLLLYMAMQLQAYMEFEKIKQAKISEGFAPELPKPAIFTENPTNFYFEDTLKNSTLQNYPKVSINTEKNPKMLSKPILFISNEMNDEELSVRMDGIGAKIGYDDLLKANLNANQVKKLNHYLEDSSKLGENLVEIIISPAKTFSELDSLISLLEPVAVFIDGLYLLENQMTEGFAKATYITRASKALSMKHQVPLICTVQLRKGMGKEDKFFLDSQDEFYYGTIIQDFDVCIKSVVNEDLVRTSSVLLKVVKGRTVLDGSDVMFKAPISSMDFAFKQNDEEDSEEPI